jgi:hypothetical protein
LGLVGGGDEGPLSAEEMAFLLSPHDLRRLETYCRSLADVELVKDLLPLIASVSATTPVLYQSLPFPLRASHGIYGSGDHAQDTFLTLYETDDRCI